MQTYIGHLWLSELCEYVRRHSLVNHGLINGENPALVSFFKFIQFLEGARDFLKSFIPSSNAGSCYKFSSLSISDETSLQAICFAIQMFLTSAPSLDFLGLPFKYSNMIVVSPYQKQVTPF